MSDFIHTEILIYFNAKYKHLFLVIQLLEQQRDVHLETGAFRRGCRQCCDRYYRGCLHMNSQKMVIYSVESNSLAIITLQKVTKMLH